MLSTVFLTACVMPWDHVCTVTRVPVLLTSLLRYSSHSTGKAMLISRARNQCLHTNLHACDGWSWLSSCLHPESTITQAAGHSCEHFLAWIWDLKIHCKSRPHLAATHIKGPRRRKLLLLASLVSLLLASSSVLLLKHFFAAIRAFFLGWVTDAF